MSTSGSSVASAVHFTDTDMLVELADGRAVRVPLAWFPRLLNATLEQRSKVRISKSGEGLHWDDLDEDISVAGLLAGRPDMSAGRTLASV